MEEWMNQTWWLYDLTVAAIVLLCVWGGWRRGLIRTVSVLLGYGAAALIAGFLARPAAEYVYDRWLAERCSAVLEQKLEAYHMDDTIQQAMRSFGVELEPDVLRAVAEEPDGAADTLYAAVSQKTGLPVNLIEAGLSQTIDSTAVQSYTGLPSWMTKALIPDDLSSRDLQNRTIQTAALLLSGDSGRTAEVLTKQYLRPVILSPLKIFMFSLLFLLISMTLQVIIKWLTCLRRSDSGQMTDHVLGAAVGCVQMVLFLGLMLKLTQWLVAAGDGQQAFFNNTAIDKTILFRHLYENLFR